MDEVCYQGARWVRADFHLHSPGIFGFRLPNGMVLPKGRDALVEAYVAQLKSQRIQIAAITDYQQIRLEWFEAIQQYARENSIYVYPGIELSLGGGVAGKQGLHILAIFAYDANLNEINRSVDKILDSGSTEPLLKEDGQHRDLMPEAPLTKCLPEFRRQTGALLIVAHPGCSSGLFKSYQPAEQADFLLAVLPDAIEGQSDEIAYQKLISTGKVSREQLGRLTWIESSDNHSIEEIGAKTHNDGALRATYLKVSVLDDLRAIRLALHDPQILVACGEPPSIRHTHFSRLKTEGNGFLGNLDLKLSPEMNVLVGGRGVGKSAILEVIRFVLDLPPYVTDEYRENLIKYALGSGGKVTLYIQQFISQDVTRCFRIERVIGEEPRVYELFEPSREEPILLAPGEILGEREPPLFFGQREMYVITQSPMLRRRLLDEIIGRTAQSQVLQIEKAKEELKRNARALINLQEQVAELGEVEKRLEQIRFSIRLFETRGIAQKLQQATALEADEQRLNRAKEELHTTIEWWENVMADWRERWQSMRAELAQAVSPQRHLLQKADELVRQLQDQFESVLQQGKKQLQESSQQFDELSKRWVLERTPLDEEIRQLKQEIGSQSLDPDQLIRLTGEQTRLQSRLDILRKIKQETEQLKKQRQTMLDSLRNACRTMWEKRQGQADQINQALRGRASIHVEYRGQKKEFLETLVSFFRGSNLDRATLEKIVSDVPDGIALAQKAREGVEQLVQSFEITQNRAQQMIAFLSEKPQRHFELELLTVEDNVDVQLKINDISLSLEKLSAGQRATAMLLTLLTQEDRLLMIDQPEEDLDNRFIFDDIVSILREQKGRRQLIIATHNPNIPVLGHAELIVALEASADKTCVVVQGAIDHYAVQEFVRRVMEGGEEAFRRRAQKYGLE